MTPDREHQVRERAHARWEAEGRPDGRHADHWAQAEAELRGHDDLAGRAPDPDAVDEAGGADHGNRDFGGGDAETAGPQATG